jgi:transglutaminase-like putative cysteine protease
MALASTLSRNARGAWVAAASTLLVATTLSTVIQGVSWFVDLFLVVLAVAGTGALAVRVLRHPAAVLAAQAFAVLLLSTWLFALPEAFLGLLPGPAALGRLAELVGEGVATAQNEASPAPGTAGLRLLVCLGVGGVALAVDLLAAWLRQPAVAGLPLLAVYCVPAALARGGLDWYWFVFAAAGFLLLVASDAGSRVARWGKVLSGQGGEQAPMAATGRRVGALALVAAVIVPTLVPGLSEGLLPGSGSGSGSGPGGQINVANPLFDLRENLAAREDVTVLTYRTDQPRPEPLRWVIADTFNGNTWGPATGVTIPNEQKANGSMPSPPGLTAATQTEPRRMDVTVDGLGRSVYLPAPYPPTHVDVAGDWLYEADTLNIIGNGVSTDQGLQYSVDYLEVTPENAALAQAPPAPADVVKRRTALPDNMPPAIADIAKQVAGTGSEFEKATKLQEFFRSSGGFQYSEQAPDGTSSSAIADFLQRRSGFCVHFASAMAVMARTLGIPARVAVGFLPGQQQEDGTYRVSLRDAHAWPELYFAGAGWIRFEPTPATRTGALPAWAAPLPADSPDSATSSPTASTSAAVGPRHQERDGASSGTTGKSLGAVLRAVPWRLVGATGLVLVVLASPLVTSLVVRRRRWRGARTPAEYAEAAWTTLAEKVTDLGVGWPRSATPRQIEDRLGDGLGEQARQALHRLARAVEQGRYARTQSLEPADRLRHDVTRVVKGIEENRPPRFTWRARLLPRTGMDHLRGWLIDSGLAVDAWERRVAHRTGALQGRVVNRIRRRLPAG